MGQFIINVDLSCFFGLFIVSQISWILCVRHFLDSTFSLTDQSISSMVSSRAEIFSCISYILLGMLASIVPVHLPRFSISRIPSICVFFIASISIFRILKSFFHLFFFLALLTFFLGIY